MALVADKIKIQLVSYGLTQVAIKRATNEYSVNRVVSLAELSLDYPQTGVFSRFDNKVIL